MKKPILLLLLLLLSAGSARAQGNAAVSPAGSAAAAPVTPVQAAQALDVLQDAGKRNQLIETLQTIAKAQPPTTAAVASTPSLAAATPSPATAAAAVASPLKPNSLGEQLLRQLARWTTMMSNEVAATAKAVTDFPLLWRWVQHLLDDAAARATLLGAAWRLAVVLGCALIAEWLAQLLLRRPIAALETSVAGEAEEGRVQEVPVPPAVAPLPPVGALPAPSAHRAGYLSRTWRLLRRLPLVLARFILELLPVAACGAVGVLLLGTGLGSSDTVRLVILAVLDAYLLCRVILCVVRMLVSPSSPQLRLLPVGDQTAVYLEIWSRRIAVVAVFGNALAEAAVLLGLNVAAHDALVRLAGLLAAIFLVIIVLQCRRTVADLIRAPVGSHGAFALLRNRLGDIWHYIAVFLVIALWVIWAVEVRDGVSRLSWFCAVTAAVLIAARLASIVALGVLDRIFHIKPDLTERFPGLEERANRYYPLLRGTLSAVLVLVTAVVLLQIWGFDALNWFRGGAVGSRLISAALTVVIALAVAIAIWESFNAAIDRHLDRLTNEAQTVRAVRLRTLLPMLRTTLLFAIIAIVGLTALSEIGVNIAPLLAGAGIVGIAVGFGSQKLVQDVITGLFLLLENAMQVGDQVTVAGLSGVVENLSIRTIRLRAGDGSVHVIPFSSVTSVTNTNRGIGNAAVSVNVSYAEDTDRVGQVLTAIAAEMREDPAFKTMMLSDLQLWGVDKVDASMATVVGQIVCTASGRWGVQREFNRRLKKRFEAEGIEIANPTQTIVLRPTSGAAKEEEDASPTATEPATEKLSPPPQEKSSAPPAHDN